MKSEQVEGVAEKLAGKAQSAVGKLIGDSKMEAEGAGHQAAGQLTKTYGDTLDSVFTFVKEKPVARTRDRCCSADPDQPHFSSLNELEVSPTW